MRNVKITCSNNTANTKEGTNEKTLRFKGYYNCGFCKLVSLAVFHISLLMFVTFDIMLWERHFWDTKLLFSHLQVNSSLTLRSLANEDALLENGEVKQRRRRRQRERQKSNRFRLAKQQLGTCITLFCTLLCRHCTTTT